MRSHIRGWLLLFVLALGCVSVSHGQIVKDVVARQRYPWNSQVDIDYTLEGVELSEDSRLGVNVKDCETGKKYIARSFDRMPPLSNGRHRITWNPEKDGISLASPCVQFEIFVQKYSLYMVIDLSSGASSSFYPVTYMDQVPPGGWPEEYKTTKLVLRRIPAGRFIMGSPIEEIGRDDDEIQHEVTLTRGFYMGVFEVTEKQWQLVMGNGLDYPSVGEDCPVECLYDDARGRIQGSLWPFSSDVDASSFIGRLRSRTGMADLDIPTEAQWEYACRAGTVTALNSGKNLMRTAWEGSCPNMDEVGRYYFNSDIEYGGHSNSCTVVGLYLPNNWGLYDMHGNMDEWCLDGYWDYGSGAVVDPVGVRDPIKRVRRGGRWNSFQEEPRSACRSVKLGDWNQMIPAGIRLASFCPFVETDGETLHSPGVSSGGPSDINFSALSDPIPMSPIGALRSIGVGTPQQIAYSSLWNGNTGENAILIINDEQVSTEGQEGFFEWTPDRPGEHHLMYVWGENCYQAKFIANSICVKDVVARQRYPWKNQVDIDYTLEGMPDNGTFFLGVNVENWASGQKYTALSFDRLPPVENGRHRITWDAGRDGVNLTSENVVFEVFLMKDPVYLVIDLSSGPTSKFYPVSYLDRVPYGGWGDEYKTTKLVLRKIPAGTFRMGSHPSESTYAPEWGPSPPEGVPDYERLHDVTLTRDFYIGVFEVTQRQWELVMGSNPSFNEGKVLPVDAVSYDMIRGSSAGAEWPQSTRVDQTSFMGRIRSRTGIDGFDLPTEAQWEYACRAGTSSAFNNGENIEKDQDGDEFCLPLSELGNYQMLIRSETPWSLTSAREKTTTPVMEIKSVPAMSPQSTGQLIRECNTLPVGMFKPNAWELYDMHGNIEEWCLDWFGEYDNVSIDPVGANSGQNRAVRGGCWTNFAIHCRSAYRSQAAPSSFYYDWEMQDPDITYRDSSYGFRLSLNGDPALQTLGTGVNALQKRGGKSSDTGMQILSMPEEYPELEGRTLFVHAYSDPVKLVDVHRPIIVPVWTAHPIAYSERWWDVWGIQITDRDNNQLFSGYNEGYFEWEPQKVGKNILNCLPMNPSPVSPVEEAEVQVAFSQYAGVHFAVNLPVPTDMTSPIRTSVGTQWKYEVMEYSYSSSFALSGEDKRWVSDEGVWPLDLPFEFPFYGTTNSCIYVGSNGIIAFSEENAEGWTPSEETFKNRLMIAPLWTDLSPVDNKLIFVDSRPDSVTVRWHGAYYNTDVIADFSATLYRDGRIVFSYGTGCLPEKNIIVGISKGDGTTFEKCAVPDSPMDITCTPLRLPDGLSIKNGKLDGTVSNPGLYKFQAISRDSAGYVICDDFYIKIAERCLLKVASRYGTPPPHSKKRFVGVENRYVERIPKIQYGDEENPDQIRHVCTGWTGTGSVPASGTETNVAFTITESSTLTWNWRKEYYLDIKPEGYRGGSVNGLVRNDWVPEGTTLTFQAVAASRPADFDGWTGDLEGCQVRGDRLIVPMDRPRTIRANFIEPTPRYLTVYSLFNAGDPKPGRYEYQPGESVSIKGSNPYYQGMTIQYQCVGWTGTGCSPAAGTGIGPHRIQLTEENATVTWYWQTNYCVSVSAGDGVSLTNFNYWVPIGGTATVDVQRANNFIGINFTGDTDGVQQIGDTLIVPADRPRELTVSSDPLTLPSALNAPELPWTTSSENGWTPQTDISHDGIAAAVSGSNTQSRLETEVEGPGTLSFWWKISDMKQSSGTIDFLIDGEYNGKSISGCGVTDWMQVTVNLSAGKHRLTWETTAGPCGECGIGYLDRVTWAPARTEVIVDGVPVPYTWLDRYGLVTNGDYETAANGTAANGLSVLDCYIADLDPTDPDARLIAFIEMVNGEPHITWTPNSPDRVYTVEGRESLTSGEWKAPYTKKDHFFRVKVSLP